MQFLASIFLMTGAAVFALSLNLRLGIAGAAARGGRPGRHQGYFRLGQGSKFEEPPEYRRDDSEVQESLQNFKVIVAFTAWTTSSGSSRPRTTPTMPRPCRRHRE